MLAHNCTVKEIGVNFDRLYHGVDPDYELCLRALVERVDQTHQASQNRGES